MTTTEIAVRLYNNPKFGTTYGKGQYHNAIMNGTVDLHKKPNTFTVLFGFLFYFFSLALWLLDYGLLLSVC